MRKDKADLWFTVFGGTFVVDVLSAKGIEEFKSKCPEFIDRMDSKNMSIGKIICKSFLNSKSDESWKARRDFYLKEIGLNSASKFIPNMIEQAIEKTKEWKKHKNYDLLSEIADITFNIICIILFGKTIIEDIPKVRYIDPENGEVTHLDFREFFKILIKDLLIRFRFSVKSIACPLLETFNLTSPFNLIHENWKELRSVLGNYVTTKDENSIFSKATKAKMGDKDQIIEELWALLIAGHDTTSHAISSAIFLLTKNKECGEKLAEELKEFKGKSYNELLKLLENNGIQEYQYLHQVFKETTRIDNPADKSIPYTVLKDTTICGVPLKKGTWVNLSLINQHFNPEEWHEPLKFIPERFDPESKYYFKPGTENKPRGALSRIPFSY